MNEPAERTTGPRTKIPRKSPGFSFAGFDFVRHRIWWQLAVFIIVSTGAVTAGMKFDDEMAKFLPETVSQTSTFNAKPSGTSGLFELARRVDGEGETTFVRNGIGLQSA